LRILVTGATGMIGRSVVRALTEDGHQAVAVDRDSQGRSWRLGSQADQSTLRDSAGLVHLAWDADPAASEANVSGSRLLFEQARQAGLSRIVFVSSQSAGSSRPTRYGSGKAAVERMLSGNGELAIRPGLVWSDPPRGTFARVVHARLLGRPVAARTGAVLQPVHVDDLAGILARAAVAPDPCGVIEVGSSPPVLPAARGRPADRRALPASGGRAWPRAGRSPARAGRTRAHACPTGGCPGHHVPSAAEARVDACSVTSSWWAVDRRARARRPS
jgi:nucleoside-diphosphate-sugar epimerase